MAHNFNVERTPNKHIVSTLLTGVFLTALTAVSVDRIAEDKKRHNGKKARVIPRPHEEGHPIYIMPGCRADGEYIGEMLEPHIKHIGDTYHEAYADEDFDLEDLKSMELESRSRDLGRAAVVFCSSMGGMKFTLSLADKSYREQFGKINTLIFDSSPAAKKHLDSGTRFAMFAAKVLPPSWTISKLYRNFMMRKANKPRNHSPKVTDDQVRGHLLSSANTPLSAVRKQADFIENADLSKLADGELAGAADTIYYISSQHDHVVDTDAAYKEYNRIFGGNVIRIIDYARDPRSHADGPEHPELIVALMEGRRLTHDMPSTASLFVPDNEPVPALGEPVAA